MEFVDEGRNDGVGGEGREGGGGGRRTSEEIQGALKDVMTGRRRRRRGRKGKR